MRKVDWTKWSAIAEVVSSVAIIATLVYLAIQTQQNTAAVQAATRQAMLEQDRESLYKLIDYPFLDKRTDLTPEEATRVTAYITAFLRMRENHWLQYQSGVLDEETWASYRGALIGVVFSSEFGRALWHEQTDVRGGFAPGFVDNINRWLEETPIRDSPVQMRVPETK